MVDLVAVVTVDLMVDVSLDLFLGLTEGVGRGWGGGRDGWMDGCLNRTCMMLDDNLLDILVRFQYFRTKIYCCLL